MEMRCTITPGVIVYAAVYSGECATQSRTLRPEIKQTTPSRGHLWRRTKTVLAAYG